MATGANTTSQTRSVILGLIACLVVTPGCTRSPREPPALPLVEIEETLRPIANPLPTPQPGDWLSAHPETGQPFAEYIKLKPKRPGAELTKIHMLLLGDFSPEQREILTTTRRYWSVFYQTPVELRRELPLATLPDHARRVHPDWGTPQIQTSYVLNELLKPDRPDDKTDRHQLHFCPVCLSKLFWSLNVDPDDYLKRLEEFCQKQGFTSEVEWYADARRSLGEQ